jgi:hypothetical protein
LKEKSRVTLFRILNRTNGAVGFIVVERGELTCFESGSC